MPTKVRRQARSSKPMDELAIFKEALRSRRDFLLRIFGWTEEEYLQKAPENRFCDFVDGELILHSPVRPIHQQIVGFLTFLLTAHVAARELGEVLNGPAAARMRPDRLFEPDVFFVRRERLDAIGDLVVDLAPDFCMEVISPSTRRYDLLEKAGYYTEAGVGETWFVDRQNQEVTVYRTLAPRLDGAKVRTGRLDCVAVPGFWLEVDWLWQKPLPNAASLAPLYLGR